MYLNGTVPFLQKTLGRGVTQIKVVSGFEIEVSITVKNLYSFILFLKKHSLCLFSELTDLICYDCPGKKYRFSLVYNFLSLKFNSRLRVSVKQHETKSKMLSIMGLFRSASWSEREVFDFYGLFFFENSDLRRILNDYGFKGFPLRKDFPLTGYIDTYYDDNTKKISYRKLELSQEYRNFNFKTVWRFT
jgi:NADH:ubiquinone oxidoreductase subunit C